MQCFTRRLFFRAFLHTSWNFLLPYMYCPTTNWQAVHSGLKKRATYLNNSTPSIVIGIYYSISDRKVRSTVSIHMHQTWWILSAHAWNGEIAHHSQYCNQEPCRRYSLTFAHDVKITECWSGVRHSTLYPPATQEEPLAKTLAPRRLVVNPGFVARTMNASCTSMTQICS